MDKTEVAEKVRDVKIYYILMFMKKIVIFTIVAFSCIQMNAQILTGLVYDKHTNQPVYGAYVYLDGTSIVDLTDESGKFTLDVKQVINTRLVLRHLAYHTVIIETPFTHIPDTIYMEEQMNMLGEVIFRADPFSRTQKLRAFREQFLGTTESGRACRIVNEDDIRIWFNTATNTLMASSEQPIEVINAYLGYRIFFTVESFETEYSGVTLNSNRIENVYYSVMTLFTDLNPYDERIKMRRDKIYEESSVNFFKGLAYGSNTERTPYFTVSKNGFPIDPYLFFTIKDTLSLKMIYIPDSTVEESSLDDSLFSINVSYRSREGSSNRYVWSHSTISFFTNTLFVDLYGNIDQGDKIVFTGMMSLRRAGDMLPLEYEP